MADQATTPITTDAPVPAPAADAVVNPTLLNPKKDGPLAEVGRVLQAVVYALKANYPDTFEAEVRSWGFRKESY